jgi:hypothetical protein
MAERISATHAMAACAETMAQLHLYTHDLESLRTWAQQADTHYRLSDDQHAAQAVSYLLFQGDAAEGNIDAALSRLPAVGSPVAGDTNLARNIAQRAVRLRAGAMTFSLTPDCAGELLDCASVLPRCRNLASQEFLAASVIHSWCALGQPQRAADVLSDFLNVVRFRRGPLHIDLEHARQRLSMS